MSEEQEVIIVCVPVSWGTTPVKGAIKIHCKECRTRCWLAPSSFSWKDTATLLCAACATKQIKADIASGDPPEFGGFLPGQKEEILGEPYS